ncbi:D-mannonate oxidoreductase [Aureimonas endophytica]|uniref:D-mannonate oxidoreductase n=1 Tax=Aureimonas endophytica TaxID=2027858 RepID=A0A916ZFZ8_9HYPH|nr:mannitol dehydrogenase family protein [Aureimonas endophytica]GGD95440.1 D-mannonate oxidoreductase [Aureimonas endophytica]
MAGAILQFGTSRFLQAHADLILSEARAAGQEIGPVTVVETTGAPASRARIEAFDAGLPIPIRIRGLQDGRVIDETRQVEGIAAGISARGEFDRLVAAFLEARYVVSNTGDKGFDIPVPAAVTRDGWRSFPELLTLLLRARFEAGGGPLVLLPCELVTDNGARLQALVAELAATAYGDAAFSDWLSANCLFADSLVDRIVSEPLEPLGAVAEPYALWAIAARPGLDLPWSHPQISLVADLGDVQNKKLFLLNLGHTLLAERWLRTKGRADLTVREALAEPATRDWLGAIMLGEVVPAFGDKAEEAGAYWATCLERFANPFLDHRLADIATNHDAKIARRAGGLLDWARRRGSGDEAFPLLLAVFPAWAGAGRQKEA